MTSTTTITPCNGTAPAARPSEGASTHGTTPAGEPRGRVLRAAIWLPGLAVALGAAVATAHGLYEVAVAARVPAGIAWLYPLITDGLALVAYAATARLAEGGRRYAWAVVILAAGLSGLAQAAYLATDTPTGAPGNPIAASGPADPAAVVGFVAPAALRFGVGAWPAIAAAIVAHLLYLLATEHDPTPHPDEHANERATERDADRAVGQAASQRSAEPVQRPVFTGAVHPVSDGQHAPRLNGTPLPGPTVQPAHPAEAAPPVPSRGVEGPAPRSLPSPARDRAFAAAQRHAARHGALPTVTELETAAEVSRGTAAHVLKQLREQPDHALTIEKDTKQ
ncbi:hypothetical protein [Pseudonocardia sp.]|uniref:hypothetical protein n=1 Tax=Pseudonocardia sp. TaxID=60912 RepID=UPI003D13BE99